MQQITLKSRMRDIVGKKSTKKMRTLSEIPAVLYGHGREPLSLSVPHKEFWHILHNAVSEHLIMHLDIEGADEGTVLTLVRDVQHHPVSGDVLHIDFQRISVDEKINVGVPVGLSGMAKGVKDEGGILDHGVREVMIHCKPMEIPDSVSIDISHLEIGQSVHISDLIARYPEIEFVDDPKVTLAHISPPRKLEAILPAPGATPGPAVPAEEGEEGAAEGEAAEGEAEGEKSEKKEEKKKKES